MVEVIGSSFGAFAVGFGWFALVLAFATLMGLLLYVSLERILTHLPPEKREIPKPPDLVAQLPPKQKTA